MTERTSMYVPAGTTPTITEEALEDVARDPDRVARVLVAAARALNVLGCDGPTATTARWARDILSLSFTGVEDVLDALKKPPVDAGS